MCTDFIGTYLQRYSSTPRVLVRFVYDKKTTKQKQFHDN